MRQQSPPSYSVSIKTFAKKLFHDIDCNLARVIVAASRVLIVVSLLLMAGVESIRLRQLRA